jgi:hypothetical protein
VLQVVTRTARTQIGAIVLDYVSDPVENKCTLLTRLAITNDPNIHQSLGLIMLLQLGRDLLNPSMNLSIISQSKRRIGGASDERAEARRGREDRTSSSVISAANPSIMISLFGGAVNRRGRSSRDPLLRLLLRLS